MVNSTTDRTPGVPGHVTDFTQYRNAYRRDAARRYGLPVPGFLGEGAIRFEWERGVLAAFERGASLTRADWVALSPYAQHRARGGARCARDPEVCAVLDRWSPRLAGQHRPPPQP